MADRVGRVVIMVQENHTTDNYFRGLAPFGGARRLRLAGLDQIRRPRTSRTIATPISSG